MQLDTSNKPMVAAALSMAANHHRGVKRKYCGEPYINHPIRVAERLLTYGHIGEAILSAALLHDCLEDENVDGYAMDPNEIAKHCSPRVLRWVELLSNTEKGNRAARKAAAAKRIQAAPMEVQAIKLCDIMDNCEGVANQDPGFAEVYIAEKQALVRGLRPFSAHNTMSRMVNDCWGILSSEMNAIALWHLESGREVEAKLVVRDEKIAMILKQQEHSVFADIAMF